MHGSTRRNGAHPLFRGRSAAFLSRPARRLGYCLLLLLGGAWGQGEGEPAKSEKSRAPMARSHSPSRPSHADDKPLTCGASPVSASRHHRTTGPQQYSTHAVGSTPYRTGSREELGTGRPCGAASSGTGGRSARLRSREHRYFVRWGTASRRSCLVVKNF